MKQPIFAVIPTYNSCELAIERIKQLQKSKFDKIIICDDNSNDETVNQLKNKFERTVEIISGSENLGPGGNRNRCLGLLSGNELVLFIDVDCKSVYQGDIARLVGDTFSDPVVGVVGFGILNKKGEPMRWNYGDLMHPVHQAEDQKVLEMFEAGVITKKHFLQYAPSLAASTRLLPEKDVKEVEWVAEGCMAARSLVLLQVGGFAAQMRYHETHDFCTRVRQAGYKVIFDPEKVVQHLEFDSRMQLRDTDFRAARLYYYQKHWGMSEAVFEKLYDKNDYDRTSVV